MPQPSSSTTLFVINPISGGRTKTDWETAIANFFASRNSGAEIYVLDGENDTESIKHWIEKIKPAKVVAVGGDGTVSLVARQVLGTGIALGILPAGSANGMATELNIPSGIDEALRIIAEGKIIDADVIKINDSHV